MINFIINDINGKLVTVHGGASSCPVWHSRTRSIGGSPDVKNWTKAVLQAVLTTVFLQFSPSCEL